MKAKKHNWNHIASYLSGEMNSDEEKHFRTEMDNKSLLANEIELMKKTWKNHDSNPAEKYSDTNSAWKSLSERINNDGMLQEDSKTLKISGRQYMLRVAAVIIIILSVGSATVFYSLNNTSNSEKALIKHHSPEGISTVDLPDGSRVYLNQGASLKYKKSFEENRKVELEGEGYFEVMSNPQKPFKVNSKKVTITVLGTSFNVKETQENDIEVFVESGKVEVALTEKNEALILLPGEMAKAGNQVNAVKNENQNYLSWKTKEFKFVDQSLNEILQVLQNAYHVAVETKDVNLEELRLTTTYAGQSFEAILSTICTAHKLNYTKEKNIYTLYTN